MANGVDMTVDAVMEAEQLISRYEIVDSSVWQK